MHFIPTIPGTNELFLNLEFIRQMRNASPYPCGAIYTFIENDSFRFQIKDFTKLMRITTEIPLLAHYQLLHNFKCLWASDHLIMEWVTSHFSCTLLHLVTGRCSSLSPDFRHTSQRDSDCHRLRDTRPAAFPLPCMMLQTKFKSVAGAEFI